MGRVHLNTLDHQFLKSLLRICVNHLYQESKKEEKKGGVGGVVTDK